MKKGIKIAAALGLCIMMTASMAACGGTKTESGSTDGADTEVMSESAASEKDSTASETASQDLVTIKWVTVGGGMPSNYDKWQKHINEYLGKKIGVNLDVEVIPWADFDKRRSAMINTNEDFDIMFTNLGTYASDSRLGAFLDISDMVKNDTPDLYAVCPEEYWKAVQVDGKIYGVPTYKDSSLTEYFVWDADVAEKYGVDYKNIHDLQGLTEGLKKIQKGENKPVYLMHNQGSPAPTNYKYDGLGLGLTPIGVAYNDTGKKVVSVYEQPDVMKDLQTLREWYLAGIINQDASTAGQAGNKYTIFNIAQGWSSAASTTWGPNSDIKNCVAVQYGDTVMSNDTVQGSINCISANSKNPKKALELLQLVNTDSYVRDALYYGLEGENFNYTADKKIERINNDWTMAGYTQGTFFIVSPLADQTVDQWEEVKKLNENAKQSPVLGLSIDPSNFSDELANCVEIYNRYKAELTTGAKDPEELVPVMMKELRAAGFDKIVSEVQKQVDAYK